MENRSSCVDLAVGPLWTERCPDGKRLLLRPLVVKPKNYGKITVPAGFITDFSSFPWGTRWVARWSKADIAGVVHDWLYVKGSLNGQKLKRQEADRIWKAVALSGEHSANGLQAWLGHRGLAFFGVWAWKNHRGKDKGHRPVCPEKPQRSQQNDCELEKFTASLVQQRERQNLEEEAIANKMSAHPRVINRFEKMEKADTDFRLVMLLRYAAAIGATIRLTKASTSPDSDDDTNTAFE